MSLTNDEYFVSSWVGFSFGLISCFLSFLTLVIIYIMCKPQMSAHASESAENPLQNKSGVEVMPSFAVNESIISTESPVNTENSKYKSSTTRFSGYLLLIVNMALFQILYDINYIIGINSSYSSCIAWHFLDMLGGLSVTIWSNILSFVIFYVVTYIRSLASSIPHSVLLHISDSSVAFFCLGYLRQLSVLFRRRRSMSWSSCHIGDIPQWSAGLRQ